MMTLGWALDEDLPISFIAARSRGPARSGVRLDWLVVHTTESSEAPGTALAVAKWFAGPQAPKASAHYVIDPGEVVQCVHLDDTAWAAPGANSRGIHLEHCGRAAQTPEQWADEASAAMLARSARLAAQLAKQFDIPVRWINSSSLRSGERGFTGHVDVTEAFSHGQGHTDPGPNFPWPRYLEMVAEELAKLA